VKPKSDRPQQEKKGNLESQDAETYCWNPKKMLEALMKGQESWENNWAETDLPLLVDEILRNYETFGGMDHLAGKDLPSKKVVIEVLEDLLTVSTFSATQ
jgi:hypothetical protein